jgi:hypothetical protein
LLKTTLIQSEYSALMDPVSPHFRIEQIAALSSGVRRVRFAFLLWQRVRNICASDVNFQATKK